MQPRRQIRLFHLGHRAYNCRQSSESFMGITTRLLTFEQFEQLPAREGITYELDEGELLMEPSPALRHNLIRQSIALALIEFVKAHRLGVVVEEMDFRLGSNTVRNPDVAFITAEHLKKIDLDRSPVDGAPALAVEVISPSNFAQDMAKKVQQYLEAGSRAGWLVYPALQLVEIHEAAQGPQGVVVRQLRSADTIEETTVFAGLRFPLSLKTVFENLRGL
jgi:Uma2 family endonuclease